MDSLNILLETSRQVGGGSRVRLNLNAVQQFALFPGQVIGLEGTNNLGHDVFTVSHIYQNPLPLMNSSPIHELHEFNYGPGKLTGEPLSMLAVSGPFSLEEDDHYLPFQELLDKIRIEMTNLDILLLTGPFVDEESLFVKSGKCQITDLEMFQMKMALPLLELLKALPQLNLLLVPSHRDFFHPWVCFPQPAFSLKELFVIQSQMKNKEHQKLFSRIKCLPNPCMVTVNEIHLAVSTMDILGHLSSEEITRFPATEQLKQDRLGRLTQHLFLQRSFYPLMPSPASANVYINHEKSSYYELQTIPDILILPSKLTHFVKNVEGCLVVNPGFLSKKQTGGTFASFTIHPMSKDNFPEEALNKKLAADEEADELYHGVEGRTRVEIIRI